MFIDARRVESGTVLRSTVCIVGGGIAGITAAREFERRGIDTILLESGGFTADPATRDLYRGENIGLPYVFADNCRSRFLGGSSNCWGGWCAPLRPLDMAARPWVAESGWPFGMDVMQPLYERAHDVLRLGPVNYDMAHWVKAIDRADVRRIPLPSGEVEDLMAQFSSPSRLGSVYRDELEQARHVRTVLYANVVDIEAGEGAGRIERMHVKTLSGRSFTVAADHFVLACGGIENARLLLSSNKVQRAGLGNGRDLVGRYFADHPRFLLGSVKMAPAWRRNKLYDIKFQYLNPAVAANGTFVSSQFALTPEVQAREGLLNARLWFSSVLPGEGTAAAGAVTRMKHRLQRKGDPSYRFLEDIRLMATDPLNLAAYGASRLFQPQSMVKDTQVEIICEPAPNRDSRVTLGDELDQLGMQRVRVDWRLTDQVKLTCDRALSIFANELRQAGVAEVALPEPLEGRELPVVPPTPWHNLGTWHHMGTTRMNDSPALGVVDRDGKVHGIANLYIAGSSVFPTYGANFPSITIAALALKLADHLASRIAGSGAQRPPAQPSVQDAPHRELN